MKTKCHLFTWEVWIIWHNFICQHVIFLLFFCTPDVIGGTLKHLSTSVSSQLLLPWGPAAVLTDQLLQRELPLTMRNVSTFESGKHELHTSGVEPHGKYRCSRFLLLQIKMTNMTELNPPSAGGKVEKHVWISSTHGFLIAWNFLWWFESTNLKHLSRKWLRKISVTG